MIAIKSRKMRKRPSEFNRSAFSSIAIIDQGFFIFAGLASIWLAFIVFRGAVGSDGWWLFVALFVLFWIASAYLALPRIHRILSSIYVPNYFIGRARTADGLLGDSINLAIRGSEVNLRRAMTSAGWHLADEVTFKSVWKMIVSTIRRRSYVNAPVSALYLFGRRHDFSYQQEVDNNPRKRHHVRFWRCPEGWLLPGGYKVDWLASGTYDKSIGLSLFTFQITHKIDENIDIERDYVVETVTSSSESIEVDILQEFSTGYHSRNGGGDSMKTDGNLVILDVGGHLVRRNDEAHHGIILDKTNQELGGDFEGAVKQLWSKRPIQIVLGSGLVLITLLVSIISLVISLLNWPGIDQVINAHLDILKKGPLDDLTIIALWWTVIGSMLARIILIIVELILVIRSLRGSELARIGILAISSVVVLGDIINASNRGIDLVATSSLINAGVHILIILLFSSDSARRFTRVGWTNKN